MVVRGPFPLHRHTFRVPTCQAEPCPSIRNPMVYVTWALMYKRWIVQSLRKPCGFPGSHHAAVLSCFVKRRHIGQYQWHKSTGDPKIWRPRSPSPSSPSPHFPAPTSPFETHSNGTFLGVLCLRRRGSVSGRVIRISVRPRGIVMQAIKSGGTR